jgi:hypothetical protein
MTENSFSSRRKAPSLDPEDFASWEMLFQNYCGYQEWELFWKNEPEVDMDQMIKSNNFKTLATILMSLAATRNKSEEIARSGRRIQTRSDRT